MGPIAYSYNPKTFLYSGPVKAQPCKIQLGVFYAPRFSTFDKPPEPVPGRAVAFDDLKKSWIYVAAPKPVEVLKPKDVEKVVEVRENSDLLNQMIANERMILGIELQKKLDVKSREVLEIVMTLDSKIQALEAALNGIRAVVQDNAQTCNSALATANASMQEIENLKPGLEQMIRQVGDFDIDRIHLKQSIESLENRLGIEKVESVELVSSVVPKKSWKFWS